MWALEHMCLCRCEHMCVCLHMYEYILVLMSEGVCALLYGVGCIDEGLSVEEGKASKCYCGHRLYVPWPLQKVTWPGGCLGRGVRSDTVLRIQSASRGPATAGSLLSPSYMSLYFILAATLQAEMLFLHFTDVKTNSERLSGAPELVNSVAGIFIQVYLNAKPEHLS